MHTEMEKFRLSVYPWEHPHATLFIFSPFCLNVVRDYLGKKMWAGEDA